MRILDTWENIESHAAQCHECELCHGRTQTVIGTGNRSADIMFVGEAPGRDEDIEGVPFVGAAGQLLTKMLRAVNIERSKIYISNVVKCRPPNNRTPNVEEKINCLYILRSEYMLIKPKIIVCLGATAACALISDDIRVTRDRGKWFEKNGLWIMPTFHPSALLRDETKKPSAWEDMKSLANKIKELNIELS